MTIHLLLQLKVGDLLRHAWPEQVLVRSLKCCIPLEWYNDLHNDLVVCLSISFWYYDGLNSEYIRSSAISSLKLLCKFVIKLNLVILNIPTVIFNLVYIYIQWKSFNTKPWGPKYCFVLKEFRVKRCMQNNSPMFLMS